MGELSNIEVISRLERLEARMRVVESRPNSEPPGLLPATLVPATLVPVTFAASSEMEVLIREQGRQLESLQGRLAAAEGRIIESGQQIAVASTGLPPRLDEELEHRMDARMEEVRAAIESDLAKLNRRTVTAIERGVDERIGVRTSPIEKAVRNQAKVIEDLRERVNLLEKHLQRLVVTVQRLVDRPVQSVGGAPAATTTEPPSFRTYLDHAVKNEPMPAPPDVDPLFRPRIIKEEENRANAPRRPLSPLT